MVINGLRDGDFFNPIAQMGAFFHSWVLLYYCNYNSICPILIESDEKQQR